MSGVKLIEVRLIDLNRALAVEDRVDDLASFGARLRRKIGHAS